MKSRTICSGVLLAAMLLAAVSCGETETQPEANVGSEAAETAVETEAAPAYLDSLSEELDFGGAEIKFLSYYAAEGDGENSAIFPDDTTDVVNAAFAKRTQELEDRLNVVIRKNPLADYSKLVPTVTASVSAGDHDYDIVMMHTALHIALCADKKLYDLSELESFDFSKSYWSSDYINKVNIGDKIYIVGGDATLSFIRGMMVTYVNNAVWNQVLPDDNIYDIVKSGKWTVDNVHTYAKDCYQDVNNDGLKDKDDTLGLVMANGSWDNALFLSLGGRLTENDSKSVTITVGSEHNVAVMEKLTKLFVDSTYAMETDTNDTQTPLKMLTENRALFLFDYLVRAESTDMRNMKADFSVVPPPKFDEAQQNYMTALPDGITGICMPVSLSAEDAERNAAVLEAFVSMTSQSVIPVYYDLVLKNKYTRDPQAAEMIDLIHDSIVADFGIYWGYSSYLSGMTGLVYEQMKSGKGADAFLSACAKNEKRWNKEIVKLLDKFMDEEK